MRNKFLLLVCGLLIWVIPSPLTLKNLTERKQNSEDFNNVVVGEDGQSELLSKISEEFMNIDSPDDRRLICVLFSGSAEYIKNCQTLESTRQFDPILGKVQSSYGWDRERYPSFTDAVSEYLIDVGYDEPMDLDNEENREQFYKIFSKLAEATRYEK